MGFFEALDTTLEKDGWIVGSLKYRLVGAVQ